MQYLTEIKGPSWSLMLSKIMYAGGRRRVCTRSTPPEACSAGKISLTLIGHRASVGGSVSDADWSRVNGAVDKSPGGVWIDYIRQALGDSQSIVAVPVTGSLVSPTLFSCRDVTCTARSSLYWTVCGTDWVLPAGYQVLLQELVECWTMDADGFSIVDNRAGVTFGVELYIPWDAPEAVVDISSAGAVPLRNVPDVFGLVGHRDSVTESRVLQGRDARSIRVLVPDCRGLDQNFHDVTVMDMGDLPESHAGVVRVDAQMTSGGHKSYDVAATRAGRDAQGGKSEVPTETSVAVYILWHTHQVRYVSACGARPLGVGPVMAVSIIMVYHLEGHASGLDGPCSRGS